MTRRSDSAAPCSNRLLVAHVAGVLREVVAQRG